MERINLKKEEQLDEYIKEKKWKLAFKLVESRQKKGDRSDSLLVRKIIILLSFQDESRIEQGKKELVALQQKKPPITDRQALKRLDNFLSGRKDRDDFSNNLWAVAGAASQDEDFLSTWFYLKFDQQRWEAAQKAAQTWQKAFPKQRTPFFLWILSSHLVSIAPGVSDMSRKVAQGFAQKLLAKAAEEVPVRKREDEDPPSPARSIKTEQDLLLLIEVYTAQSKYSEALAVLENPRTGFESHLAQDKWDIARHMVGLYELSEDWKGQWDVCSAILVNARPDIFDKMTDDSAKFNFGQLGDDWRIWDSLVTACGKLDITSGTKKSHADRTDTIIDQYCKDHKSRNASLANVKLHSVRAMADLDHQKPLASICKEYFYRYCTKVTCFQDLRPYVPSLDREHQSDLLQAMRSCAANKQPSASDDDAARLYWITAESNVMKFDYHFVISRDDNINLDGLLPAFVCNCVRLYKSSLQYDFKLPPSDRLPGDDAAILAAMALIRMYRLRHVYPTWACSLLRSVALLEFVNNKSPHNYDILLILVRIYMYLGAGSLALGLWTKLAVKNMQNMTVSWMLFTRLSTIHPYPVTVPGIDRQLITVDPLEEAVTALNWHQRASQLSLQSTDAFLKNGQWVMELDALEAKSALQNGFSRLMLLGEASRARRFRYPSHRTEEDSGKPARLSQNITDTRDSTAFPNYEAHGQMEFWRICPSVEFAGATATNEKWLTANLRQALVWDSLCSVNDTFIERTDLESLAQTCGQQADAFSSIENVLFNIGELIQKSLDQLPPKVAKSGLLSDSVGQILLQINALNKGGTYCTSPAKDDTTRSHFGSDLHTKYCMLEICQFVRKFVTVIEKADRSEFWMKKMVGDLQAGCERIATNVRQSAVDLRADVEKEDFVSELYQKCGEGDEIGDELRSLFVDTDFLHNQVIRTLQKSWIDALEGVIKTNVIQR